MDDYLKTLPKDMQACILGGALGDALGFLLELQDIPNIQSFSMQLEEHNPKTFPEFILDYTPECWVTHKRYKSGQVSDDTQTTLILSQSLYEGTTGNFNEMFIKRLRDAFNDNLIVSYGNTTKNGCAYPNLPPESYTSTSNGSLMRISPLGVHFKHNLSKLIQISMRHSKLTHPHEACQFSCAVQSIMVALLCSRPKLQSIEDKIQLIDTVISQIPRSKYQNTYLQIKNLLELTPKNAEKALLSIDIQMNGAYQNNGISMHALSTLIWAHYCFLNSPTDYWKSLCKALHIGGDIDTAASITGSLSGTYNGLNAIPEWSTEWVKI